MGSGIPATPPGDVRWAVVFAWYACLLIQAAAVTSASLPARAVLRRVPAVVQPVKALAASRGGVVIVTAGGVEVLDQYGQRFGGGISPPADARRFARSGKERRRWLDRNNGGSWSALDVPGDVGWARGYDWEESDDPDDPRFADEVAQEAAPGDFGVPGRQNRMPLAPAFAGAPAAEGAPGAEAVAITGRTAWVEGADGLWNVDLEMGARAGAVDPRLWGAQVWGQVREVREVRELRAVRAVASAPNGATLAVAHGDGLFRSRDGGRTFDALESPVPVQRALAVTADGTILFIAEGSQVWGVLPTEALARRLVLPDATDLAACGSQTLVLARGELLVLSPRGVGPLEKAPVRENEDHRERADHRDPARRTGETESEGLVIRRAVTSPPGASRIWCSYDGALWVANGTRISISLDEGGLWTGAAAPPGTVTALAVAEGTIWLGASSGLWQLSPVRSAGDTAGGKDRPRPPRPLIHRGEALALGSAIEKPRRPSASSRWAGLLPKVDLLFATSRTASRRELRGLVVLTFSASGGALLGSPGGHPRGGALQERAETSAEEFGPLAASAGGDEEDLCTIEEAEATRRLAREELQP